MKTDMLSRRVGGVASCAGLVILITGCVVWTEVSGVKPVYPEWGTYMGVNVEAKVDSLQPELKWKGGDETKKYDLAIWNTIKIGSGYTERKIIYKKIGLTGNSHKVEIVLEPNAHYFWSVREAGTEAWSKETIKWHGAAGIGSDTSHFWLVPPSLGELQNTNSVNNIATNSPPMAPR